MNPVSGVVLFVVIWMVVLFAVLPVGVEPDVNPKVGMPGAPRAVHMGRKIFWTTIIAVIFWGVCYIVVQSDWLSFRNR